MVLIILCGRMDKNILHALSYFHNRSYKRVQLSCKKPETGEENEKNKENRECFTNKRNKANREYTPVEEFLRKEFLVNWKMNFVTYSDLSEEAFYLLNKRIVSLSIHIESTCTIKGQPNPHVCDIRIVNQGNTFDGMKTILDEVLSYGIKDDVCKWKVHKGKENWVNVAILTAKMSTCMKTQVGAVIVKDNKILTAAYNETAEGSKKCIDGGCERCNHGVPGGIDLDKCVCLHAEENAISNLNSNETEGAEIIVTLRPCLKCSLLILNAGIKKVSYIRSYKNYKYEDYIKNLFREKGVIMERANILKCVFIK
eukprot:GHVP01066367.1.p1 GENE.GHVP01066367.1~~GHVP01066367.1.p1  ORF type:complete len:312 (+),score=45.26 GHVP01066367.1:2-937(+)